MRSLFHSVQQDIAFSFRSLRSAPAVTVAILLTLTLGIGATTAMYSVVGGVLLRPLPFEEPDKLVKIGGPSATAAQIDELRKLESVLGITALGADAMVLEHEGSAVELRGLLVDGHHHRVFGESPILGRAFNPDDSLPGAESVLILGHSTWVNYFDSDPEIVGKPVQISGQGEPTHTVVGVQGPGYRPGPWTVDFIVPHRYEQGSHEWLDMARFWAIARIGAPVGKSNGASGEAPIPVTREQVQLEARDLALRAAQRDGLFKVEAAEEMSVVGLLDARVGSTQRTLWLLFAVVGLVLFIACVNVANLLIVRGISRSEEFALRAALGAGRRRLARQMITEGLVISLLGGALGVWLAYLALPTILASIPSSLPRAEDIALDGKVLVFAALLSVLVGVFFGLTPLTRVFGGLRLAIRRGGGKTEGTRRLNHVLVAGQVAMALVLLTSCGLLVRSLMALQTVNPGFEVEHLHTIRLSPPTDRYAEETRASYYQQVEAALSTVPGVTSVGSISNLPLTPGILGVGISPDGNPVPESQRSLIINYRAISPGYLDAARVPLLRGRNISVADRKDTEPVGLVNRRLAERLFPNEDPIGQAVAWGTGDEWFTVVGVIGDVHQVDLATDIREEAYVPYAQESWIQGMNVLARTDGEVVSATSLSSAVRSIDPLVPITSERMMTEVLTESMSDATFNAAFFGGFALLGLLLSAIGVYGVTLHVVSQRTKELGVRMALGANRFQLLAQVVTSNLPSVGLGLAAGLGLGWVTAKSLQPLLFGVNVHDPLVIVVSLLVLGGGALLVSGLAARRIVGLQPTSVLGVD